MIHSQNHIIFKKENFLWMKKNYMPIYLLFIIFFGKLIIIIKLFTIFIL